jgi:DMSO/TMAO reductase YedYZ heme-binding membrane subunit
MIVAKTTSYSLLSNSRFYILLGSLLISLFIVGLLRLHIPNDQLYVIRLQQLFGLFCLIYWYFALIISPVGSIIGKPRMRHIEFARRAIGVSAFYFALLHAGIALWGQLGGLEQLRYLPSLFQWSLAAGAIALGILCVMAATSFDAVVKFMTYKRWKWLHRLVYTAFILVVLHVWSIGTHLAYPPIQLAALAALVLLSGLELLRFTKSISDKYLHLNRTELYTLFLAAWICVVALIVSIPAFVQNYHSRHTDHARLIVKVTVA